jgi:ABC-2 type transport system ATP-binding protein
VPALEVVQLRKQFPRRRRPALVALDGISFSVARGECVAVLGQNGSGKSTLVRLLSTLLSVDAPFFKRLSPTENLAYSARFYGLSRGQTRRRIPEILAKVGFPADRAGTPMEDLSRGMQQKVALARALLTSPVLLLLDEPTTGLDPRSKREVQGYIRDVRREHDTTTLLCTHDMDEAEALADRVGILDGGRLLALDDAPAVKRRFGAATLEDAFLAATGRDFEDEAEEAA